MDKIYKSLEERSLDLRTESVGFSQVLGERRRIDFGVKLRPEFLIFLYTKFSAKILLSSNFLVVRMKISRVSDATNQSHRNTAKISRVSVTFRV